MANIFKKVNLLTKSNYSISFCMLTPVCFGMEKAKEVQAKNIKAIPGNIINEAITVKKLIRDNKIDKLIRTKKIAKAARVAQAEKVKAILAKEIAESVQDENTKALSFFKTLFPDQYLNNKDKKVNKLFIDQLNKMKSEFESLKMEGNDKIKIEKKMKEKLKGLGYSDDESYIFLKDINKDPEQFIKDSPGIIYKFYQIELSKVLLEQLYFQGEKKYDANGNSYFKGLKYEMSSIVGRGGFSIAVLAKIIKEFIENGIVKEEKLVGQTVFKFSKLNKVYENEFNIASRNKNINVVNLMSSGHICKILEDNQEYKLNQKIALLGLEYCQKGDLLNFLYKCLKIKQINESLLCYISGQVLNGLIFLHQRNICHLDIKPQNILVDNLINFKISDFSVSKLLSNENDEIIIRRAGTENYMAPEILNDDTINKSDLYKADVFSFGVMLYWLFTDIYPYDSYKKNKVYYYNNFNIDIKLLKQRGATDVFIDFLKKCLAENYNERSSSFALLRHPFIADFYCALRDHKEKLYNVEPFLLDLVVADCLHNLKTIKEYEFNKDGQLVCKEVKNEEDNIINLEESEDNNIIKNNINKKILKITKNIKKKYNNIIRVDKKCKELIGNKRKLSKKNKNDDDDK